MALFSQTAEYALRAVVSLAEHIDDGPVDNQRLAEETQVPVTYLAKIMQQLVKADLVNSRRGVGGGFALGRTPDKITVLDVVNVVDPIQRITSCPLRLKAHSKSRCAMHARLDMALESVETALSASTIADILNDDTRPIPMRNRKSR